MINKKDKKFIAKLVSVKVIIIVAFIFIVLPIYSSDVVCVTSPCPAELKSGIDLISQSFEEEPQVACIEIFMPVCGVDGNTYSNQCFADIAGVDVLQQGECG